MIHPRFALSVVSALTAVCVLAGCGERPATAPAEPPAARPAQTGAGAAIVIGPEATALLARADAADGASDHVVSNCPGCGLGMRGDAEYSAEAGPYTLHFCSDHCRGEFTERGEAAILALDVPQDATAEP